LLLSMTGFGEAHSLQDGLSVRFEVRAINSRYFKLSLRGSEGYAALEPRIEAAVRRRIRRGTVQVSLRVEQAKSPDDYRINGSVLESYRKQLHEVAARCSLPDPVNFDALLALPGVVEEEQAERADAETAWPIIGRTLETALENLLRMRADEGGAMAKDLQANCQTIVANLEEIEGRAPGVVDQYRRRLHERLSKVLAEYEVTLEPADLLREVGMFTDRSDISEETVRLKSHLEQFRSIMALPESAGRKLEFLTQEMFREANTIGSKANDVEITAGVIEIKTAIERIREMIQNVE